MFRSIEKMAALLYLDNNYEISRSDIVNKYLEGIFVVLENVSMAVDEISTRIEDEFKVVISESEISDAIEKYTNEYKILKMEDDEYAYSLKESYYQDLQNATEGNLLDRFISDFIDKNETIDAEPDHVKDIIWKFLYELFGKKIDGFSHLIGKEIDYSKFEIESLNLSSDERRIINEFLNYNNPEKDRAIFNIACYALEYCLFVSNLDSKSIIDEKLTQKTFYLDTNILFRALGINGERRERRTRTFLRKCISTGQKLSITNCTLIEFSKSIEYHCNAILGHHGKKVNSKIYHDVFEDGDVEGAYYDWAESRINAKPEMFQSTIDAKLRSLIKEFNIHIDEYEYAVEKDFQTKYEQIKAEMKHDIDKDLKNIVHDAFDLQVITQLRENYDKDILSTEYFYISTDYTLKVWDDSRAGYVRTPRIFYPDQWLTLLIRFSERSVDDIKSFISFVNLSINHPVMDGRRFNRIVSGIVEITEDFKTQREIVEAMIATSFSVFQNAKLDDYESISSNFSHNFVDERISNTRNENEELKNTVNGLSDEVDSIKRQFEDEKNKAARNAEDKERAEVELRKLKTDGLKSVYKKKCLPWILVLVFQLYVLASATQIYGENYNLYNILIEWAAEDTWKIKIVNSVTMAIILALAGTALIIHGYVLNEEKQMNYVNTMLETE